MAVRLAIYILGSSTVENSFLAYVTSW